MGKGLVGNEMTYKTITRCTSLPLVQGGTQKNGQIVGDGRFN